MKMSLEEKLIFLGSRTNIEPNKQKLIKDLLKTPIDWSKIINLSRNHGITPLLYYNLNKLQYLSHIPKNALRVLKDNYVANLVRNITLWKELSELLSQISQAQIKMLLFKGSILAQTIYPNPALREFADIDILIKDEDLTKIKAVLLNRDYKEIKQRYTFLFIKPITPNIYSCLELHTMLVPARPYKIQIPQLWQRAQEEIISSQKVDYLSNEDTFLSLALHIRRHTRVLPLKFICDIAELLKLYRDILDWKYIEDLAIKNHIKNTIYFCLYICHELLDTSVSDELLGKLNPNFLNRRLMNFCMNKHNFLRPHLLQGYILRLLLFDSPLDCLIYLWRMIIKKRYRR